MVSACYCEQTGMLVLTSFAFGAGHLLNDSGEGQWWHRSYPVKSGRDEIERKWRSMGSQQEPVPCLLFLDRFAIETSSPDRVPDFDWIRREVATHGSIHITAEVVRVSWLDPTVEEGMYPWRLRVTATRPFRFTWREEIS